jgi:hypothetical protein
MPDPTLHSATDTYVTSFRATTNYGAARALGIGTTATYALLYFSQPMALGSVVTSAKLRLFYDSAWATATTVTAQRVGVKFSTSNVTWNTRPAVVAGTVSPPVTAPAGPAGTMIEIDVRAIMQTVADGAPWYGLQIATPGATRWLTSSEGLSDYRPQLYVAWSEEPHAPTSLSPDGNDAVSVAEPVVRFQVTDVLGDTTIAAVNVQTASNSTFTSGLFDSGWILTGDPQLDLATLTAPDFPALAEGQSVYWRVRVKDGAGLISAWSDDAQLRRVSKKALTIDNPAPGSPAFVNDPTPPILWSFAGTQVQWQVTIVDLAKPSQVLADSGRQTNTQTAWPVWADAITSTTATYRVRVRVWDDVDRDPTDAVIEAERDFVYTHDPATPGITGLAVTQPDPWPSVMLTWNRATAPDSWVIERDGHVIEPSMSVADSSSGGTAYAFEDEGARSWVEHTWNVGAKVNGKVSGSASVTYTPTLRGIWIMDKGRGIRVWLAGADDGSWTEPEDATSLAPLGSDRVVRLVQGVRNREGTLSGLLVGASMAQYQSDLILMRNEPSRPVVLAVADYSLRVLLGNVQFAPTATHVPPSRLVSFDFWEV